MLRRILARPQSSVLLLGPRGTGKSTWIGTHFAGSVTYDLLDTRLALRLAASPGLLYDECSALPRGQWIVIDEIQKVPALLDEVHRLIEQQGLRFVLSGSSARKLKRGSSNLLAGRAESVSFFPLVAPEVNFAIPIEKICFGMLPQAFISERPQRYLRSYCDTYLKEEIQNEALTRNIGGFVRFLEVSARQCAQVTNVSNISRDAEVARQTVQGYFEILVDTLVGFFLPAFAQIVRTKQVAHPKFYFFDAGVVRALSGRLPYQPTAEELGVLFETWLVNEVRAYLSLRELDYPMTFWRTQDGVEVDLVIETSRGYVAIELKATERWRKEHEKGLTGFLSSFPKARAFGVYLGARPLVREPVTVLPYGAFLEQLWGGDLIR